MRRIFLFIGLILIIAEHGYGQIRGVPTSYTVGETLFVDIIMPQDSGGVWVPSITISVTNVDSVGHKSLAQIKVMMRDSANAAIRDSLINHYKKSEVLGVISDSLHLFDQITEILGALDSLASKLARNAFKDSVAAIDSTKITDGKLGVGDINNLWALINARALFSSMVDSLAGKLARSAFGDSAGAMDSTYVTDGKLGVGDINNLWALINARALFTAMVDSFATKATTGALADSARNAKITVEEADGSPSGNVQVLRFASMTITISNDTATVTGSGSVGNADSLGGVPAASYMLTAAFGDSAGNIDSTYIENDKLGLEDINNLPELLGTKRDTSYVADDAHVLDMITLAGTGYVTNLGDSLATKTTAAQVAEAIHDSSKFPLDTLELNDASWVQYIQTHQEGAGGSIGNADSLGGVQAAAYAQKTHVSDTLAAHRAPGIVTLFADFPNESFRSISAGDDTVSVIVSGTDTVYMRFYSDAPLDSIRMTVVVPIPPDFAYFNADTALLVRWWGSGNSADSSFLDLDVLKYPTTAELDSSRLTSNKAWGSIVVPGASLGTNTYTDGDALRLNFTVGVKNDNDVRLERVVMKYVRK